MIFPTIDGKFGLISVLLVLLTAPYSAVARLSGQWYELPPEYFFQLPDEEILATHEQLYDFAELESGTPKYLEEYDLNSGVSQIRVTDNARIPGFGNHRYSKHQVWNADESVLDIGNRLLDANSYEVIQQNIDISSARNWSHTQPEIMFGIRYIRGTANSLSKYNYVTGTHDEIYRFVGYEQCTFGAGEGNTTTNDKYVLVSCVESGSNKVILFAVDMMQGVLLGTMQAAANYNWASFSQSGQYIVVENKSSKSKLPSELLRFSPSFEDRLLLTEQSNHGDLGRDIHGDDVYVMIDWDYISYIRLKDGTKVNLAVSSPTSTPSGHGHVSCRNVRRPGWCYFSSYSRDLIGAVKIAETEENGDYIDNEKQNVSQGIATVELWAAHNSQVNSYLSQPKVSVSPTGMSLIFSSNWFGSSITEDYVLSVEK